MKNFLRTAGISILALSLGILLAPRAGSIAQLTARALQDQVQSLAVRLQAALDAAAPGVAIHAATLIIFLGAVAAASFIYLLVFAPLRIHSIQRELRRQGEQIQSIKSEVHLSSELLLDARRDYDSHGGKRREKEPDAPVRLRNWVVPRRDGPFAQSLPGARPAEGAHSARVK